MIDKVRVQVTYPNFEVDEELDRKIKAAIESVGGEWYASGVNVADHVRDICFDIPVEKLNLW